MGIVVWGSSELGVRNGELNECPDETVRGAHTGLLRCAGGARRRREKGRGAEIVQFIAVLFVIPLYLNFRVFISRSAPC